MQSRVIMSVFRLTASRLQARQAAASSNLRGQGAFKTNWPGSSPASSG